MALHNLIPVISVGLLLMWKPVHSLDRNGQNVCSTIKSASKRYVTTESYQTSYTTSCGFLWLNRCRRYRRNYRSVVRYRTVYSRDYICCNGYAAPHDSDECTDPICAPPCDHGTCVGPNMCQCDEQFHGPTCEYACDSEIDNCETVDCTDATDSVCIKCIYGISDVIKAYDLVNGMCEQRCSWRSDSKSCYPGTCNSNHGVPSCSCATDFQSDPNCMTIDDAPTVSHCSISLQHYDGSYGDFTCQNSQSPRPSYSSLKGNGLSVNWQTRFTGPSTNTYPFPYYVNDFRVGVTSAVVEWKIIRGGSKIANGSIDCHLNHDKDDPNQSSHSCTRYEQLTEPLQHSDSLIITALSTNGGYLRLNDYEYSTTPTVSEPTYYQGRSVTRTLNIIIDLEGPEHCSLTVPPRVLCSGNALEIEDQYTKSNELEIRWSTWEDNISGLRELPYDLRVCKLVVKYNMLDFDDDVDCVRLESSRIGDDYEAEFNPTSPGVYCAVLGVSDTAGNIRYARRCFIFDDQSEISIVNDKPMELVVDGEKLALLESDVWTTGDKNIHVSWRGHFVNQLHIDRDLLLAIEPDNNVINEAYDSDANPAGRPLSAIDNRDGIVKFEVGVGTDRVGGATFDSFQPNWTALPSDLDEMFVDQFSDAEDAETYGFWVRATDVVGNTKTDFVYIHIDSTPPQIENIEVRNGIAHVTAYDRQSGIKSVRWRLISKKDGTILSEGYTTGFEVTGDCVPTDCYCILVNKFCYKLQLDVTPTVDQTEQELGATANLSVTLKNNALLNISKDIEVALASFSAQKTKTEDDGLGTGLIIGIIAAGVVFLVLLLLLVALAKQRRRSRDPGTFGDDIGHANPCFTNDEPVNHYAATQHPLPPAYTPCLPGPPPVIEKPKMKELMEDEYASPFTLAVSPGNITLSEIHPRDISKEGVIVEGNHSQVYRGSVSSLGLTNVAVKTLKDNSKVGEKETLLHEMKMIRMLPNHENVVRLLGFTRIRDPVAIVMEFAPKTDLSKYLQQSRESLYDNRIDQLSSAQLCIYAQQVCSGMQHIQRHKIIHRNLGARNILVGDNKVCKITDFGRAVVAEIDGTFVETQEIQLPVRWTAVEGLRDRLFSMKSDVWSFGVLMWEIVTLGSKPYGNMPIKKIAEDVIGGVRLTKPRHCSDALFKVMENCWQDIPDRRPSFESLYRDINGVIRSNQQTIDVSAFDGDEYMGLDEVRR